jgi:hypothetical protein
MKNGNDEEGKKKQKASTEKSFQTVAPKNKANPT